jgi:hypothetical protein
MTGPLVRHLHPRFPDSSSVGVSTHPTGNVDPFYYLYSEGRSLFTERYQTIVRHTPTYGSRLRP